MHYLPYLGAIRSCGTAPLSDPGFPSTPGAPAAFGEPREFVHRWSSGPHPFEWRCSVRQRGLDRGNSRTPLPASRCATAKLRASPRCTSRPNGLNSAEDSTQRWMNDGGHASLTRKDCEPRDKENLTRPMSFSCGRCGSQCNVGALLIALTRRPPNERSRRNCP